MKLLQPKRFRISLALALLCSILLSFSHFEAACEEMRGGVLRLHIIANSDSDSDQEIKLAVRDAILTGSEGIFEEQTDLENAIASARASLPLFEEIANDVLRKNGFAYGANAKIGKAYFETREYPEFTLPAGEYDSLIIRLGEGKGKNWWCVVFPAVCVPTASDGNLRDSLSDGSATVAENAGKYVMKFKSIEIYEEIKEFFKRK